MEIKAYINEQVGAELRKQAISRFSYFKGSLSNAVEEAIIQWLRRNERIEERMKTLLETASMDDNVVAVFLFGSYAKRKTDYRDIDLAFLLKDPGEEISVLSKYGDFDGDPKFDISCLNSLGTILKNEVLDGGTILLSKDNDALHDFADKTIKEYSDFRGLYELMVYG